jgi:hypothetical protein
MGDHFLQSFTAGIIYFLPVTLVSLNTLPPISLILRLKSVNHLFVIDYFSGNCLMCFTLNFTWWNRSSEVTSLARKKYVTQYGMCQTVERCLDRRPWFSPKHNAYIIVAMTKQMHLTNRNPPPLHTSKWWTVCISQVWATSIGHSADNIFLYITFRFVHKWTKFEEDIFT